MRSSKIIRGRRLDDRVKNANFKEVGTEALYQGGWATRNSKIIRDTSNVPVFDFPLFTERPEPRACDAALPHLDAATGQRAMLEPVRDPDRPPADTEPDQAHDPQAAIGAAQDQAEVILQQAQEAAAHCLEEARQKASGIEAEAYAAGLQKGREAAQQDAQAQLASVLGSLQQAISDLPELRQNLLRQAEQDIITLAVQIARRICQHEALQGQAVIASTLRRALAQIVVDDAVVVRVNPADLDLVRTLCPDLLHDMHQIRQLSIEGDATIGRGGCVVDSDFGELDARIEAQLEELEHGLRAHSNLDAEAQAV